MRKLVCSIAAVALLLAAAPGAPAAIVTIGPPLEQAQQAKGGFGDDPVLIVNASPMGVAATSPVSGTVVRWRLNQTEGGPFRLRVLRPNGGLIYTTLGASDPVTSPSPALQTFPSAVRIQAGDTIGLEAVEPADDQGGFVNDPAFAFTFWKPPPPDGVPTAGEPFDDEEAVALNADVQPIPSVTGVTPSSGNIRGGTKVTIAGTDFIGVTGLTFGGKVVTNFSVDSESQITLTTPASRNRAPPRSRSRRRAGRAPRPLPSPTRRAGFRN